VINRHSGESVPVTKTPLLRSVQDPPFDVKEHARHILSCGTNVIQTKSAAGEDVIALVLRTGIKIN
jgi:cation-transporting ATPase 13A2